MDEEETQDTPRYFFKYRSIAGDPKDKGSNSYKTRDIIERSRLYWPSPLSFNDPFDCLPANQVSGSKTKRELKLRKALKTYFPHLTKTQIKERARRSLLVPENVQIEAMEGSTELWLARVGVCSLSTTPSNVLMWSHYSDSHRGVCIQFEPSRYWAPTFSAEDLYFEEALPVIYADRRPVFDLTVAMREQNVLEKQFLTKAQYWSYEQEWRLIRSGVRPGLHEFPEDCLNSIILGAMISEEDEARVREWNANRDKPARIKRAVLHKLTYELEIISDD